MIHWHMDTAVLWICSVIYMKTSSNSVNGLGKKKNPLTVNKGNENTRVVQPEQQFTGSTIVL